MFSRSSLVVLSHRTPTFKNPGYANAQPMKLLSLMGITGTDSTRSKLRVPSTDS